MSKKLISLLLAVCMLICLSACGTTETNSNVNNTQSKSQTDTTQNTDESTQTEPENNKVSSNTVESKENDTQTQTTVSQSKPTSTTNQPTHTHSYSNATCTSPKKCSCGATAGTALGHQFSSATCTSPQICSRCGTTSGNALGHSYSNANCNSPKTCTRCGQTSGSALGHNYVNNKCSRCGKVNPDSLPVGLDKLSVIDCSGTTGYSYKFSNGGITDAFGNNYAGYHYFKTYNNSPQTVIYNLNYFYKTLAFDIIAPQDMLSDGVVMIEVYVDGTLEYCKSDYAKTTGKIHADINVKNGGTLTIKATRISGNWTYPVDIALVNAKLLK